MPALKRVPNGYPVLIKEAKKRIRSEVTKMQQATSQISNIKDVVQALCKHYDVTTYYIDPNTNKMQVDMDFSYQDLVPVSVYVQIDQVTKRYTLCDRIVVWTNRTDKDGEEYWIDNYKW